MQVLAYILVETVSTLILTFILLLCLRMMTSWLPFDEDSALVVFLYTATEPLILPVRNILERNETIASLPFDISFAVTYMLLFVVQLFLPAVSF